MSEQKTRVISNEATPDVLHIVHVLTLVKVELNIYGQHSNKSSVAVWTVSHRGCCAMMGLKQTKDNWSNA